MVRDDEVAVVGVWWRPGVWMGIEAEERSLLGEVVEEEKNGTGKTPIRAESVVGEGAK